MSKRQIIITAFIVLVFIVLFLLLKRAKREEVKINTKEEEAETFSYEFEEINITIDGAFKIKGHFKVPLGWKIKNIIQVYGITQNANLSEVDLEYVLQDNDYIYIPVYGEEKEEIKEDKKEENIEDKKVNINTASKEELMTLPGIGVVLAQNIIDYRKSNPFKATEDIMNVSGIKREKYEKIKDLITVQ